MAAAILFSILFRQTATAALAGIALWIVCVFFVGMLAGQAADLVVPVSRDPTPTEVLRHDDLGAKEDEEQRHLRDTHLARQHPADQVVQAEAADHEREPDGPGSRQRAPQRAVDKVGQDVAVDGVPVLPELAERGRAKRAQGPVPQHGD